MNYLNDHYPVRQPVRQPRGFGIWYRILAFQIEEVIHPIGLRAPNGARLERHELALLDAVGECWIDEPFEMHLNPELFEEDFLTFQIGIEDIEWAQDIIDQRAKLQQQYNDKYARLEYIARLTQDNNMTERQARKYFTEITGISYE